MQSSVTEPSNAPNVFELALRSLNTRDEHEKLLAGV